MELTRFAREHLERVAAHYDATPTELSTLACHYRRLLAHHYRRMIPPEASVLEVGCGAGHLLECLPNRDVCGVDLSARQIDAARARVPHGTFLQATAESLDLGRTFDFILLSETLNQAADVQQLLARLHRHAHPGTRILGNVYSNLWRPALAIGTALGVRTQPPRPNWLTRHDLCNFLALADWEPIKFQPKIVAPLPFPPLDALLNRWVAPLLPWFCLTLFFCARPRRRAAAGDAPTVSVIIPARNEAGNVDEAITRTPHMGAGVELIFVEGHSRDRTWDAIQEAIRKYPDRRIRAIQQSGEGKGNAVREGFALATGDVLMILDADLTMPPEELPKFLEAIANGHAELANGVRLVYPMADRAMRFLNLCANRFFGLAFSWVLDQPVRDTLCGTKVLRRSDYERIAANRSYFGDFDPFGDFDLLFGADRLNMKIADVPIRYRDRTYGTTNIHRWRHGALLFRMLAIAAHRLKFV